jgi:hypothetical protein
MVALSVEESLAQLLARIDEGNRETYRRLDSMQSTMENMEITLKGQVDKVARKAIEVSPSTPKFRWWKTPRRCSLQKLRQAGPVAGATNPYRRPVAGAEAAHIFAPIEGLSSASTSEVPVVVDATTSVLPETTVGGPMTGQLRQRTTDPLGLVRLCRIAPGIVPANQRLYKLEKQSG